MGALKTEAQPWKDDGNIAWTSALESSLIPLCRTSQLLPQKILRFSLPVHQNVTLLPLALLLVGPAISLPASVLACLKSDLDTQV